MNAQNRLAAPLRPPSKGKRDARRRLLFPMVPVAFLAFLFLVQTPSAAPSAGNAPANAQRVSSLVDHDFEGLRLSLCAQTIQEKAQAILARSGPPEARGLGDVSQAARNDHPLPAASAEGDAAFQRLLMTALSPLARVACG